MDFRIRGLLPDTFRPLFALSDAALAGRGIQRAVADDSTPGYPCRVSLAHAEPGEELLLLSHEHQPAQSPYRAAGPILIRRNATAAFDAVNLVPDPVRVRLLSLRAYDAGDLIVDAEVVEGRDLEPLLTKWLAREEVSYLHIHYARHGCFACRVDKA